MGRVYIPDHQEFPVAADVVVIGGGIVGVAVAFFTSRYGLRTVVLERRDSLGTLTTAASSECFRAQFMLPEHIKMMQASIAMFENFADLIGIPGYDIGLHQPGYLYLTSAPDGETRLEARVKHQHSLGLLDVVLLTPPQLQKSFPYVSPIATAGTYRPGDGWCSLHEVCYGLAKGSTAQFLLETEAKQILTAGSGITGVQTSRGMVHTETVVLAAGPFSRQVAQWVGVDLLLKIFSQQEAVVHHHEAIPRDAPVTIDLDTAAFWRPEAGGGGMVSTGLHEPSEEPVDPVPTDWAYPAFAIEAASRLSPFWLKVADSLTRENVSVRAGQIDYTPDKKPIIGLHPDVGGLYLSVGHSGHGVMASLEAGRLLAALMVGNESDQDNPFSMRRFTERWRLATEEMVFDQLVTKGE
jgi:sarcosine oxidase subunit beta